MTTKIDLIPQLNRLKLQQEVSDRKLNNVLENQNIIIQQLLFVLDYLIGDDEKRAEIEQALGGLTHLWQGNEKSRMMKSSADLDRLLNKGAKNDRHATTH
ncbi:MAG: hypothetical protein J6W29_00250 [Neisseriaceae bacterium]|nr:hypothetical protein [Neisseriaceae bacterium]